jgi:hypothetical protein
MGLGAMFLSFLMRQLHSRWCSGSRTAARAGLHPRASVEQCFDGVTIQDLVARGERLAVAKKQPRAPYVI